MNFLRNSSKSTSVGEDDGNPDSASRSSNLQSETNPVVSHKALSFGALGAQLANLRQAVDSGTKNVVSKDTIDSLGRSKYKNHENPFGSLESYSDSESGDNGNLSGEKLGRTDTKGDEPKEKHHAKSRGPKISDSKSESKRKSNEFKGHRQDNEAGRPTSQEPEAFQKLGSQVKDIDTKGEAFRRVKGNVRKGNYNR